VVGVLLMTSSCSLSTAFVEKNLIKREDKDSINETVSYSSTTYKVVNADRSSKA
jgi:hypothetical protein